MRLLAIQELPQSKRVKLVFDDDTVLKTQPYLLADFGLYSGTSFLFHVLVINN